MSKNIILKADNLYKSYTTGKESFEALRGVSLSLEQGEMLAVMGSSGSGKSTLLHILGAMDAADRGEIWLNGELREDYGTEPAATKIRAEQIGFIFQDFNLIQDLTVEENVAWITGYLLLLAASLGFIIRDVTKDVGTALREIQQKL